MYSIKIAIGLMSGTSIDGIDVSLIKSDGHKILQKELNGYYPYDDKTRKILRNIIENNFNSLLEIKQAELIITQKHIEAVNDFIKNAKLEAKDIDIIGFSGHTIIHDPENLITWQIGNPHLLASKTKINVISDFRTKDVVNHGQGAPLVPIYHHHLFKYYNKKPIIILNIGGVSNITYLQDDDENNIIACDICFGNAPMDDLILKSIGKNFDKDGEIAKKGKINQELANIILKQDYFSKKAPKSLDRNHFHELLNEELVNNFNNIKIEDALKTICYIIAKSLDLAIKDFKNKPKEIIICGGGRKNKTITTMIREICKINTIDIDDLNLDGDFIESQAFAFLAIRNLKNLPITFQQTTGVAIEEYETKTSESNYSSCGGVFYPA